MNGGLAQLVERLHGMQEVIGSNPLSSTLYDKPLKDSQNKFKIKLSLMCGLVKLAK